MGTWLMMFLLNLLIPTMMLFFGFSFTKHAPKNINYIYGYRTSMSMKNQDTWQFAHNYCGKLWRNAGLTLLIITVALGLVTMKSDIAVIENVTMILVITQILVVVGSIIPVEHALKNTFDSDGNRK